MKQHLLWQVWVLWEKTAFGTYFSDNRACMWQVPSKCNKRVSMNLCPSDLSLTEYCPNIIGQESHKLGRVIDGYVRECTDVHCCPTSCSIVLFLMINARWATGQLGRCQMSGERQKVQTDIRPLIRVLSKVCAGVPHVSAFLSQFTLAENMCWQEKSEYKSACHFLTASSPVLSAECLTVAKNSCEVQTFFTRDRQLPNSGGTLTSAPHRTFARTWLSNFRCVKNRHMQWPAALHHSNPMFLDLVCASYLAEIDCNKEL